MVVTQRNFSYIYETGKLACDLGVQEFCATKATKPSSCPDFSEFALTETQVNSMFSQLLRLKREFGVYVSSLEPYPACLFCNDEARANFGERKCSAGKTSCTVGADGEVRPCSHAPMSYGNITERNLMDIWHAMREWRDETLIPSVCKEICMEYPKSCGAGCRIEALNAGNGLGGSDPYCKTAKPKTQKATAKPGKLPCGLAIKLLPSVKFRREEFGYIAYRNSSSWQAIDTKLYAILVATLEGGRVTAKQIAQAYSTTEADAIETMSVLLAKHIVE
jgi:radical SAM protein with 4Fe4S-binding SPASM domain